MSRPDTHIRLTFAQRRLLEIVRSFGAAGATERQISPRYRRLAGRIKRGRR